MTEETENQSEHDRYVEALIARGEAARAVNGELPGDATHEIVEDEDGNVTVVRRRFSVS